MSRFAVTVPVLTLALATLAGCGAPGRPRAPEMPPLSKSSPFSSEDAAFVQAVNKSDLAQVEAAKVAVSNTTRNDIRALAETVSKDSTSNRDKLAKLVGPHNLTLTTDAVSDDKDAVARLGKLHGRRFDTAYAAYLQKKDAALDAAIRSEIALSKNADLIALAKDTQTMVSKRKDAAKAVLPVSSRHRH